jgi:hypothetical protein
MVTGFRRSVGNIQQCSTLENQHWTETGMPLADKSAFASFTVNLLCLLD